MGYFSDLKQKLDGVADEQDQFKNSLQEKLHAPPGIFNDAEAMGSMSLSMKPANKEIALMALDELRKRKIRPGVEHLSPEDASEFKMPWAEKEYNYRLENIPNKKYLVQGKKVLGHIGLDDENAIKAAYINKDMQGQGLGKKMYDLLLQEGNPIKSDDPYSMEPAAKHIWDNLREKMPSQVTKSPSGWEFNPKGRAGR